MTAATRIALPILVDVAAVEHTVCEAYDVGVTKSDVGLATWGLAVPGIFFNNSPREI